MDQMNRAATSANPAVSAESQAGFRAGTPCPARPCAEQPAAPHLAGSRPFAGRPVPTKPPAPSPTSAFVRAENEDDDGYDPYSDRPARPEPLFESDPWR